MLNELEMSNKSNKVYQLSQDIDVQNRADLERAMEILRAIKHHRDKVVDYWKPAKESASKAYKDITLKEKEMLKICDNAIQNIKDEILSYHAAQKQKIIKLSKEAEKYRKQEIKKLLEEAEEAERTGDKVLAESKNRQAKIITNLEKYTSKIFEAKDGIPIQKRWYVKILDNKSVPVFFGEVEIREINTKKLLDLRKENTSVNIPGTKFYQEEILMIRG